MQLIHYHQLLNIKTPLIHLFMRSLFYTGLLTIFSSASNLRRVSFSSARFRLAGPKSTLVDLGRLVTVKDGLVTGTDLVVVEAADWAGRAVPLVTDLETMVTGVEEDGAAVTFGAVLDCTVLVAVTTDTEGVLVIGATRSTGRPVAESIEADVKVLERDTVEPGVTQSIIIIAQLHRQSSQTKMVLFIGVHIFNQVLTHY